jgi:predicted ArsR family transcriptional regulator
MECLLALEQSGPMTSDEVADMLGRTVLAVRPRLTELKLKGLVVDTGTRRANDSGRMAAEFKAAAQGAMDAEIPTAFQR